MIDIFKVKGSIPLLRIMLLVVKYTSNIFKNWIERVELPWRLDVKQHLSPKDYHVCQLSVHEAYKICLLPIFQEPYQFGDPKLGQCDLWLVPDAEADNGEWCWMYWKFRLSLYFCRYWVKIFFTRTTLSHFKKPYKSVKFSEFRNW